MTPNVPHLRLVDEQRAARPDAEECAGARSEFVAG